MTKTMTTHEILASIVASIEEHESEMGLIVEDNRIQFGEYEPAIAADADRFFGSRTIGSADPIVFVGVDGFYDLIAADATAEQIKAAVIECYPSN